MDVYGEAGSPTQSPRTCLLRSILHMDYYRYQNIYIVEVKYTPTACPPSLALGALLPYRGRLRDCNTRCTSRMCGPQGGAKAKRGLWVVLCGFDAGSMASMALNRWGSRGASGIMRCMSTPLAFIHNTAREATRLGATQYPHARTHARTHAHIYVLYNRGNQNR